uniref:Uncharacterized protein n=1 Tax=Setaria viridis TaxID=4556 RepID=A0A4V6DCB0_SETVI|nr:hypothetical protein SEVIR_1G025400v2 [Setaria viridis]
MSQTAASHCQEAQLSVVKQTGRKESLRETNAGLRYLPPNSAPLPAGTSASLGTLREVAAAAFRYENADMTARRALPLPGRLYPSIATATSAMPSSSSWRTCRST